VSDHLRRFAGELERHLKRSCQDRTIDAFIGVILDIVESRCEILDGVIVHVLLWWIGKAHDGDRVCYRQRESLRIHDSNLRYINWAAVSSNQMLLRSNSSDLSF